jgi:DNA-binding NarL/FixJ family response regulator
MPIRVLIADDSAIIRKAVRRLLESEPEIEILGEAVNLPQMLELRSKLHPDIVVMDLHMLDAVGITAAELDAISGSDSRLLAISASNPSDGELRAMGLGAAGYIDKMELFDKLIPTLRDMASSRS